MRMKEIWLALLLLLVLPSVSYANEKPAKLLADDGSPVAHHPVDESIEREILKLPGIVIAGNPRGRVTLAEFYDVNCPYCKKASADLDRLVKSQRELRLILVPFPVLGIASIQGTRVELAVARLGGQRKFYEFHRLLNQTRGVVDGAKALAAAEKVGLDRAKVLATADGDDLADIMKAHVKLGDVLAIQATPGFVIQGTVIVGYPGPKAMEKIVAAAIQCGAVVCDRATSPQNR